MYIQYSYDFPGITVDETNDNYYVNTNMNNSKEIETLYRNYLENNINTFKIDENHASGLYALIALKNKFSPIAVKGQITGPLSMGLSVIDENGKPLLYNYMYIDLMTKLLSMRTKWLEKMLHTISSMSIISVDEPYLGQLGSGFITIDKGKAIKMISEVLSSIDGIKGIHCCDNTDWGLLMELDIDIVFFDAYKESKTLFIYTNKIQKFIERGGIIGWGIVPNNIKILQQEGIRSLTERMETNFQTLAAKGIDLQKLLKQSLLTPSCGLNSCLNTKDSEYILNMLRELSLTLRKKYNLDKEENRHNKIDNTMHRLL